MFTISMILSVIAIIILAVVLVYLIKRYKYIKEELKLQDKYETRSDLDIYGIFHNWIFNKKTGHIESYTKSNGEEYEFCNDEKGRLTRFKNHCGTNFKRKFNDNDQVIEFENLNNGNRESYEYDEHGRVSSCIRPNGVQEWYYYNEDGKVWRTKDSEGKNTYNLSNMPKNWEAQHV